MNITFFHDLDTGFLAATLKPVFEALGHHVTIIQRSQTYIEENINHVDFLLDNESDPVQIHNILKETDFFIIRAWSDDILHAFDIAKYATNKNAIFKVHGSELRDLGIPYSLKTWRIDWHGREPFVCAPRDPSMLHLYRQNTITQIERPCDMRIIPKKKVEYPAFAITCPTNSAKKGTQLLTDAWKSTTIPLKVITGVSRTEALQEKSHASFFIDSLGMYYHGPYGMNSVEAWLLKIPVFSHYRSIEQVLCPELPNLIHNTTEHSVQHDIENYTIDKKQLSYAYTYAKHIHNPLHIAQQYLNLYSFLSS